MEFKPSNIRTWSILGQRGTFGTTLEGLAKDNNSIIAVTADLCNASGLDRFQKSFPDRLVNVGIAEQNMIGVAAGISQSGNIVFATTFANFASLRACEQIRHFLGYMQSNVKVVGLSAGFGMELFGVTHYGLEDIAAIRAIPNITIISPADGAEVVKSVHAAAEISGPVYIRLTGVMNQPMVYKSDFNYQVGKANKLKDGIDVGIIASGSMVFQSLEAAKILESYGISCSVYDMHTIKPLDIDAIDELHGTKLIVSVEEHSVIGGLGGAVSEYMAQRGNMPRLLKIGIQNVYPKAGEYSYMLETCGLTAEDISRQIIKNIKQEDN